MAWPLVIWLTVFPHIVSAEIQRSQYIRPKVIVHKGAETIQGRKLIKGRDYMRKYGICTCASAKALQKIGDFVIFLWPIQGTVFP